jgi:hypothetical protein
MTIILLTASILVNICLVIAIFGFMEETAQQYLTIRSLQSRIETWKILDRYEETKGLIFRNED